MMGSTDGEGGENPQSNSSEHLQFGCIFKAKLNHWKLLNDGSCVTSVLPLLLPLRLRPSGLTHIKWSLAVKYLTLNYSAAPIPAGLNKGAHQLIIHSVAPR